MNASYEVKEPVLSLKDKTTTQHWFSYFQIWNCPQVPNLFYDWPVKYYYL